MQRVNGTVARRRGRMHAVLRTQGDGRRRRDAPLPPATRRDLVALHIEEVHARMQRFAHQQLEGALGGFQFVAFVFHLLDALQQFAARVFGQAVGQAVLLELVDDVAAAGEIAHQHALAIADRSRA